MYSTLLFKHHAPCSLHLLPCTLYYVLWAMPWPQGPYLVGPTNNIKSGYEQHWPQGLYLERPTNNSKSGYEQHWRSIRGIDLDQCHPHSFKLFFIRVCGWLRMYYNAGRLCHQCSKEWCLRPRFNCFDVRGKLLGEMLFAVGLSRSLGMKLDVR